MNTIKPVPKFKVLDEDTDSLSAIPLAILPLESVTLRGLLMVKNIHMQSVVQLFRDSSTGAGHVEPQHLNKTIGEINSNDMDIVSKVGMLHCFDVYSLRISLRDLGIEVNDTKFLKLSPKMQADLDVYVKPFTAKLVRSIYGNDADSSQSTDISQMLRDADPNKALQKLKTIADKLKIDLPKVPVFLEDYGDIYLSIAYYRNKLELITPAIANFLAAMETIQNNNQLKSNPEIHATAKRMAERAVKMSDVLSGRFTLFSQSTDEMWNNMSAEKFADFKDMVEKNHGAIGGILCKLEVKMNAWHTKFPSQSTVGAGRFADFLMTDMRQGF